jgi:hypothetical protein
MKNDGVSCKGHTGLRAYLDEGGAWRAGTYLNSFCEISREFGLRA